MVIPVSNDSLRPVITVVSKGGSVEWFNSGVGSATISVAEFCSVDGAGCLSGVDTFELLRLEYMLGGTSDPRLLLGDAKGDFRLSSGECLTLAELE